MPPDTLPSSLSWRRLPVGAEPAPGGGVHVRVWAPERRQVELVIDDGGVSGPSFALEPEGDGYHAGLIGNGATGMRYRLRLDGEGPFPDPASRWQPDGPHGPSTVIDPGVYAWGDHAWPGVSIEGQVLYELHVGTFTQEGTWGAAMERLPALAGLGVSVLEVMPVAEFPGRFGWGYDGVELFAPTRLYGTPDDFRRFVDRAHALGLGVILDVVYNHLGPDGNYLGQFAAEYFSRTHITEWGAALNFDGNRCEPVREFILANVRHWITEYHLDGLRLDATQSIFDDSPRHILADVTATVRDAAGGRRTIVVGENEPQHARLIRPSAQGGFGLDALWNDDWHHSAMVALTGRDEAYYADYRGGASELVAAARHGFLFQGQWYAWQRQPRGTPARDIAPAHFVHFLANHDQLANSDSGARLHQRAGGGPLRALTALLLLGPQTPMLFMGEEYAAPQPFLYFADHHAELMALVRRGRTEFLQQFQSLSGDPELQQPDPGAAETFERCKLRPEDRDRPEGVAALALVRDLLALRRCDAAFRAQRPGGVDGAVLRPDALVLRFEADEPADDRLLLVNLGGPLHFRIAPEPLLAPAPDHWWRARWSSESPRYGGHGLPRLAHDMSTWRIPGGCAVVLVPEPRGATAQDLPG